MNPAVCLCGKDAPDSIKQPGVNSQLVLLFQVFRVFWQLASPGSSHVEWVWCVTGLQVRQWRVRCLLFCYESLQQLRCVIFNACDALKTLTAGRMDFVVTCCLQTCWRTLWWFMYTFLCPVQLDKISGIEGFSELCSVLNRVRFHKRWEVCHSTLTAQTHLNHLQLKRDWVL